MHDIIKNDRASCPGCILPRPPPLNNPTGPCGTCIVKLSSEPLPPSSPLHAATFIQEVTGTKIKKRKLKMAGKIILRALVLFKHAIKAIAPLSVGFASLKLVGIASRLLKLYYMHLHHRMHSKSLAKYHLHQMRGPGSATHCAPISFLQILQQLKLNHIYLAVLKLLKKTGLYTRLDLHRGEHPWLILAIKAASVFFEGWLLLEFVFYMAYLRYKKKAQHIQPPSQLSSGHEGRKLLLIRVMDSVPCVRDFISSWHEGGDLSELKRVNVEQWLAWAFYSKDYSETYAVERREISEYVGMITDKLAIEENESVLYNELIRDSDRSITNHNIPIQSTTTTPTNDVNNGACGEASPISMPTTTATLTVEAGYNPEAPAPFRFNIEPVPAQYRPLVYYGFSHLLFGRVIAPTYFGYHGFRYHYSSTFSYYIYNPDADLINQLPMAERPTPLIFIHGIGVGLTPYMSFIAKMKEEFCSFSSSTTGDNLRRPMLLLELDVIAQRLMPFRFNQEDFFDRVEHIMKKHKLPPACFIGHSFGTLMVSWICKSRPHLASRYIFLDPVCFLLHHTNALYTILYKTDKSDRDSVVSFFVRSEIHFNHFCRRYFWWYQNVLFLDELDRDSLIILSKYDEIVPIESMEWYLQKYNLTKDERRPVKIPPASPLSTPQLKAYSQRPVPSSNSSGVPAQITYDMLKLPHGGFLVHEKATKRIFKRMHETLNF